VSVSDDAFVCRSCGRRRTGEHADAAGWCHACRAVVVRRARRAAAVFAGFMAAAAAALLAVTGALASPFIAGWVGLAGVVVYLAFKVARRVAFDVVRARGVPAPPE
jgi:hypothetical protein